MIRAIRETIHQKNEYYQKTMLALAETITTSKIGDDQEFPFVRVPKFELIGGHTRATLGNDIVIWAPFVIQSQREQWSIYSTAEQGWYNESKQILLVDPKYSHYDFVNNSKFRDIIWEGQDLDETSYVASPEPGPFAPLWHISPPTLSSSSINYNILHEQYIRDLLPALVQSHDCIMSSAKFEAEWLSRTIVDSQDLVVGQHADYPHTAHITPVFESLNDVKSPMVGFILSKLHWDDYLSGLFTEYVHGVDVVLRNTCNQTFTFEFYGGEVSWPRGLWNVLIQQQLTLKFRKLILFQFLDSF
jgi:hypothetical protein